MSSLKSSPKHDAKSSFKQVSAFSLFYQLTYMSAMAASGISRGKVFEIAAQANSRAATYFAAINTLVAEMRLDYPDACRRIGLQSKSDNMKSFLLRLSDALRSGEPLAEFLAREAAVQGEDYQNRYERDLEAMKQWTNAFSSLTISVALIVIIQVITAMIYSLEVKTMVGMVGAGMMMSGFGAWIIFRSAPNERITNPPGRGSEEQRLALRLFKITVPIALGGFIVLNVLGLNLGISLVLIAAGLLPVGIVSMKSDRLTTKKDKEFSTFLRSAGGMASSSGTTLKDALTRIDLSSFPTLCPDIERLSTRLQALVNPDVCWYKFGLETGSKLIDEVVAIFYGAIRIGGDPERVGYLCSLFASKTVQLRAKRRMTASSFAALSTVMQAIVAGLMVFVLSIVTTFAVVVPTLVPKNTDSAMESQAMNFGMANFTPGDLQFLSGMTVAMVLVLAAVSAASIILADGGLRLKGALFLALMFFISGIAFIGVPPMVAGILKMK